MAKKNSKKKLGAKLDKLAKVFVYLRDTDENGFGPCCTCGETIYWPDSTSHCGHFQTRHHHGSRWEETNIHLQCQSCNSYYEGETAEYAKFIRDKYGQAEIDHLTDIKREEITIEDRLVLVEQFTEKIAKLAAEKQMDGLVDKVNSRAGFKVVR